MPHVYGISPIGLAKIAANNLRINWLRSFLTILGMVFGTAAVIATLSSNEGSKQFIQQELSKLGTNILSVNSTETNLNSRDIAMISKYSELFASLSLVHQIGDKNIRYRALSTSTPLVGVSAHYFSEMRLTLKSGRPFDDYDDQHAGQVLVLGLTAAKALFKLDNPVGKTVHIDFDNKIFAFEVIGVLAEKGVNSGVNFDVIAYLPALTAERFASGTTQKTLTATLKRDDDTLVAKQELQSILGARHHGNLRIYDAREAIERTQSIWSNQNLVGILLASISLMTGGVGIMNVMLLSIYQRKREIGLRKAIGASSWAICNQFLLEAVFICLLGGILGVGVGCLFGQQVAKMMGNWQAVISLQAVGVAMGCSMITGLFFGLMPALRASRLDPYDALRG